MLQEYLNISGLKECILLDSDILTFVNYSEIDYLNECVATVSMPKDQGDYSWTASGHTFYCESTALDEFIEFFTNVYEKDIGFLFFPENSTSNLYPSS